MRWRISQITSTQGRIVNIASTQDRLYYFYAGEDLLYCYHAGEDRKCYFYAGEKHTGSILQGRIANIAPMQQWGEAGEERLWAIAQAGTLPIQVLSHSNIADAAIPALASSYSILDKYILQFGQIHLVILTNTMQSKLYLILILPPHFIAKAIINWQIGWILWQTKQDQYGIIIIDLW